MTKMKIVFFEITPKEKNYIKKKLKNYDLQFFNEPLTKDFNYKSTLDANVISPFIYSIVSAKIISQMKKLKLVATRSTGFNHIDLSSARKRNVAVANVPYYGENTVAEHTFALILALSRNLHKAYVRTSSNDFSIDGLRGFDLRGKMLGVVGAGSIGVHVIKIAKGFGMKILAFDAKPNHILTELLDYKYVPLDELLEKSDIITLHCPYNKFTHHLLNMNNIQNVKKGALFINTARSGIIEPKALYYAIENNIFSGAGLDVFEGEDLLKEENQMLTKNVSVDHLETLLKRNILIKKENVIITPHIAFDSVEAIERILDTTIENIISFFEGKDYHKVS